MLPISQTLTTEKTTISKKNEQEILNKLLNYLEVNIFEQSKDNFTEEKKIEFDFIKSQIEKYMETSKEKFAEYEQQIGKKKNHFQMVESFGNNFLEATPQLDEGSIQGNIFNLKRITNIQISIFLDHYQLLKS